MLEISELAKCPKFCQTIANRGWHAWWSDSDTSLADYLSGIERIAAASRFPTAYVAHYHDQYAGSILLIDDDLDERPQYSPWIAALWVENNFRRRGVATALIDRARSSARELGFETCFLCAGDENSAFYVERGFRILERDVAGMNIFTISS
jgi:GNAT superfamily N-acetyltransferase